MTRIKFDEEGNASGPPVSIRPGDSVDFEMISEEVDLSDEVSQSLSLHLESPIPIVSGEFFATWGGDTTPGIKGNESSAFLWGRALNDLDSIIAAGGVTVEDSATGFSVTFNEVGTRDGFTLSHSILGSLSGRISAIIEGGASQRASFHVDLSIYTLATSTTATDISEASVAVATVATGDASTAQRETVTFSRLPDRGKWQIWIAADTATAWIRPDASAYEVKAALDNMASGAFIVSREVVGETIVFDIARSAVGANAAITVSETFMGPSGVTISLDLSELSNLLDACGSNNGRESRLSYVYGGKRQFSAPVDVGPYQRGQAQIL